VWSTSVFHPPLAVSVYRFLPIFWFFRLKAAIPLPERTLFSIDTIALSMGFQSPSPQLLLSPECSQLPELYLPTMNSKLENVTLPPFFHPHPTPSPLTPFPFPTWRSLCWSLPLFFFLRLVQIFAFSETPFLTEPLFLGEVLTFPAPFRKTNPYFFHPP